MAGAGELLSGERVVVFLFVSRVLASAPLSLAAEASALLLLALAALALEISAEASPAALRRFNTRPGASSGILLGAITLPTVMMSRLIQSTRALLSHEIELQVFASTSMQYWAASACCFGVLIFFHSILRRSLNYTSFRLGTYRVSKCSLLCVVFYVFACYLSSAKSYSVWHISLKMLWFLCHGLVSVTLIQHILHTFPLCSSIGEALLASSGLVLYFCDMLAHALSKMEYPVVSSKSIFSESGTRSEISMIMQGLLLGLLLFPIFYKFALRVWMHFKKKPKNPENDDSTYSWIGSSIFFYICVLVMMTVIVPAWMHFVLGFDVHPLIWVFKFVFTKPLERLVLCVYWVLVISASVLRFYNISKHSKIERILLRKYYHLVAVLMFVPALLFQPEFLDLAFGAALGAFLILEMVRIWKIWPLGHIIHQFMNAFTDHRDSEILIISHFSLLMGCALPKWLSSEFNDRPLAPYAGILSLGIGDTMASMVGYKYGVLRWSKTGKKTIEGTAAGITSVLAACSLLLPLLASTGYIISQHWLSLLTAVTISGLLEAYTAQLDNAFIPLVFYSLLCL